MLGWIRNMFRPAAPVIEVHETHRVDQMPAEDFEVRRWGGAQTHRFNRTQYQNVTGRHINEDLVTYWETLVNRCQYELTTHPIVAGMAATHVIDVVGETGPNFRLIPKQRLQGDGQKKAWREYIAQAEQILQEWFEHCDYNGELSGCDILGQSVYGLWGTGDFLWQKTTADRETVKNTPVKLRLHSIDARRLWHLGTYQTDGGNRIVLGMEISSKGRKLKYYIREANELGQFTGSGEFTEIKARDIVHGFESREPGQLRGVPLLAPALEVISDLREYDDQVLKAAKQAATSGLVVETKHKAAPFVKYKQNGVVPFKLGGIMKMPDGYEGKFLKSEQPVGNYVDYRTERLREVGRIAAMPLMVIRLGSEEHSFASARMDSQIYQRSVRREQAGFMRKLRGCCFEALREAELMGLIPERPVAIDIGADWQQLPHVDPMKEARARQTDLDSMVTTLVDEWAKQGRRPDEQIERLRRVVDELENIAPGTGQAYLANLIGAADPVMNDEPEPAGV